MAMILWCICAVCDCWSPCALERVAVTEEIIPGFKFSRAAYLAGLLRPTVIKELELEVCACVTVYACRLDCVSEAVSVIVYLWASCVPLYAPVSVCACLL